MVVEAVGGEFDVTHDFHLSFSRPEFNRFTSSDPVTYSDESSRRHLAELGSDVELQCRAPSLTPPVTYTWTKQQGTIGRDTNRQGVGEGGELASDDSASLVPFLQERIIISIKSYHCTQARMFPSVIVGDSLSATVSCGHVRLHQQILFRRGHLFHTVADNRAGALLRAGAVVLHGTGDHPRPVPQRGDRSVFQAGDG